MRRVEPRDGGHAAKLRVVQCAMLAGCKPIFQFLHVNFLQLLDERMPLLSSRADPGLLARQLAAGRLARSRALLEAIILLATHRPDTVGALRRCLYEVYIVSFYLLLTKEHAVAALWGDYAKNMTAFLNADGAPVPGYLVQKPEKGGQRRLNYETLEREVSHRLRQRHDPFAERVGVGFLYDGVYRAESLLGVHGGLGTTCPYVDLQRRPWSVGAQPLLLEEGDVEDRVSFSVKCTAHLSLHVFREFGLSTDAPARILLSVRDVPAPVGLSDRGENAPRPGRTVARPERPQNE